MAIFQSWDKKNYFKKISRLINAGLGLCGQATYSGLTTEAQLPGLFVVGYNTNNEKFSAKATSIS
jgi:hypothetical protein